MYWLLVVQYEISNGVWNWVYQWNYANYTISIDGYDCLAKGEQTHLRIWGRCEYEQLSSLMFSHWFEFTVLLDIVRISTADVWILNSIGKVCSYCGLVVLDVSQSFIVYCVIVVHGAFVGWPEMVVGGSRAGYSTVSWHWRPNYVTIIENLPIDILWVRWHHQHTQGFLGVTDMHLCLVASSYSEHFFIERRHGSIVMVELMPGTVPGSLSA